MMQVIRVCDYDEFVGWVSSQGGNVCAHARAPASLVHDSLLKVAVVG